MSLEFPSYLGTAPLRSKLSHESSPPNPESRRRSLYRSLPGFAYILRGKWSTGFLDYILK